MGLLSEMGCNLRNEGNKKYINQKPARNSRQIGNVVGMSCYCLINLNICIVLNILCLSNVILSSGVRKMRIFQNWLKS